MAVTLSFIRVIMFTVSDIVFVAAFQVANEKFQYVLHAAIRNPIISF
jgi:myo-inositol-1-phosphate synthase